MTRGGLGALVLAAALAGAAVAAQPEAFDPARAWTHLERLVALGPRPAGSPALRQARAYITRELAVVGLTVQEQPFTAVTPAGRVEMVNLIVRLPGRRQDRIILAGHYDTKPLPGGTFVGANDGGSSAAFLIELARVLQTRDREFTWEIAWFDGEEAFCANWSDCGTPESPDNTYGSRHYVAEAQRAGALPSVRAEMAAAGVDFEAVVYPDASHAFFNDRGRRYRAEDAADAWARTLRFLETHV